MKKIILNILLLASIAGYSQSSRWRVKNSTKFGWTQKMVPVKMYSDSTWDAILFKEDLPNFGSGFWSLAGNALTNTTSFLGTTNNTSLFLKTNTGTNLGYVKLDSIGDFIWKQPSTIGQNNFQISRWKNSGFDLPAIYFGVKTPTIYNYLVLHDSLFAVFNAPQTMNLRIKNNTFLSAVTTPTVTGNAILISGISQPSVAAGAGIRHIQVSGVTLGFAVGTVSQLTKILVSADTYSANTTATVTTAIGLDVIAPTQGTGMTFTNRFAIRSQGNLFVTGNIFAGSASVTTPSAVVHLAAGNATLAAIRLTSGTLLTSTVTGAIEANTGILYWTNSSMRTEVGQILKGSATLNFPSTAAGDVSDLTIAVTNAALNDVVSVGAPNGSMTATGSFYAWVSAADVVTVRFLHASLVNAEDPASGTFKVTVSKN